VVLFRMQRMDKKMISKHEEMINTTCHHCKKRIGDTKNPKRYRINNDNHLCQNCYSRMISSLKKERRQKLLSMSPEELLRVVKNEKTI